MLGAHTRSSISAKRSVFNQSKVAFAITHITPTAWHFGRRDDIKPPTSSLRLSHRNIAMDKMSIVRFAKTSNLLQRSNCPQRYLLTEAVTGISLKTTFVATILGAFTLRTTRILAVTTFLLTALVIAIAGGAEAFWGLVAGLLIMVFRSRFHQSVR